MFKAWMEIVCMLNIIAGRVNKMVAIKYMDHVYLERGVSAVTYNNQLKIERCVFNWIKEKGYVNDNPFEQLKPKKANKKRKVLIDKDTRERIREYLEINNKIEFLIVLELVYCSLIRPKEIAMIQLKHINLESKYIVIPGENAKNHNERYAALSDELIERLRGLSLESYPQNYYLFGAVGLKIAKEECKRTRLTKEWTRIRKKLKLSDEMQLYSFRDTGINELLKSVVDPLTVMQHADHHDLAMTTRYANHADSQLISKIYNNGPSF